MPSVRSILSCALITCAGCGAAPFADELGTPGPQQSELNYPAAMCDGTFSPEDVQVGPNAISVGDLEFDHDNYRFAFLQDGNRHIRIATLDGVTGNIQPDSDVTVDDTGRATMACPGVPIGNGPEWANSSEYGYELYFNKVSPAGIPFIARASENGGAWDVRALPGSAGRSCALSSYDARDDVPLLTYIRAVPGPIGAWALVQRPIVETEIPELDFTAATGASPGRQIPGRRELVFANDAGQIARKDLITDTTEEISNYAAGENEITSVSVVAAPKYGPDAYFFYAIIENQRMDVFLSRDWGDNTFSGSLRPPIDADSPNVFVLDDENFVTDGESYITIMMGSTLANPADSSEVWFAHAEASEPCHYRHVSETSDSARMDPEPINLDLTTYIYYQRISDDGTKVLRRAATGL